MTERPPVTETKEKPPARWPLLLVAGFVILIHGAWWGIGDEIVANGGLADGDSYTRLVRIERLIETGGWFDNTIPRANAPFGTSVHWTRPFDAALVALAAPMMPVLGLKSALYWAGVIISPLFHLLAALVMVWAMSPVLGRTGALIAGAMTGTQFGVLAFSIIGRPDHHAVFGVTVLLTLGFLARALSEPPGDPPSRCPYHARNAILLGVMLALGVWMGPETLILLGLCFAATGLSWVAGEKGASRRNVFAALGLFAGLVLAVAAEKGPGDFFLVEYDRVSIVHVTLAALLLAFWSAVAASHRIWRRAGILGRMVMGGLGAGLTALVLRLLYEGLLLNPLTNVDPVVLEIFGAIAEYSPIRDSAHFLFYVGSAALAAPWVVWRAFSNRAGPHRWTWLTLAAALFVYTLLAMTWARWTLYAGFFLSLIIADLMVFTDGAINRRIKPPSRVLVKVVAIVLIAIGPALAGMIGLAAAGAGKKAENKAEAGSCPLKEMTGLLNRAPWLDRPRIIAASANFGAEILYRTPHKVVATVHHRNTAGVYDGYRMFSGKDERQVRTLVRKRSVDLLLLCPDSSHDGYFLTEDRDGTFYQRLENGDLPDWLRQVLLPAKAAKAFRLFEVRLITKER